jgi:hypothetical protein
MKQALAVFVTVICLFTAVTSAAAATAAPRLLYAVTKYETAKGDDGVLRVRISIKVTNNSNDEKIITKLYGASFTVTAEVKGLTSGKVHKMQVKRSYSSLSGGNNLDLWPGDSKTLLFSIPYNSFEDTIEGKGEWIWEGEEKTGKPPLTNFQTSNISMKYETRVP